MGNANAKLIGQTTRALLLGAAAMYSTASGPVREAEACYTCGWQCSYAWCSWQGSLVPGGQSCYVTSTMQGCHIQGWCNS
jgi:hypothetical protein